MVGDWVLKALAGDAELVDLVGLVVGYGLYSSGVRVRHDTALKRGKIEIVSHLCFFFEKKFCFCLNHGYYKIINADTL